MPSIQIIKPYKQNGAYHQEDEVAQRNDTHLVSMPNMYNYEDVVCKQPQYTDANAPTFSYLNGRLVHKSQEKLDYSNFLGPKIFEHLGLPYDSSYDVVEYNTHDWGDVLENKILTLPYDAREVWMHEVSKVCEYTADKWMKLMAENKANDKNQEPQGAILGHILAANKKERVAASNKTQDGQDKKNTIGILEADNSTLTAFKTNTAFDLEDT